MLELIPFLLERLGIMIILAFILAQWGPTRRLLRQPEAGWQFRVLVLFFATYGILSNYTGVKVDLAEFLPMLGSKKSTGHQRLQTHER